MLWISHLYHTLGDNLALVLIQLCWWSFLGGTYTHLTFTGVDFDWLNMWGVKGHPLVWVTGHPAPRAMLTSIRWLLRKNLTQAVSQQINLLLSWENRTQCKASFRFWNAKCLHRDCSQQTEVNKPSLGSASHHWVSTSHIIMYWCNTVRTIFRPKYHIFLNSSYLKL